MSSFLTTNLALMVPIVVAWCVMRCLLFVQPNPRAGFGASLRHGHWSPIFAGPPTTAKADTANYGLDCKAVKSIHDGISR